MVKFGQGSLWSNRDNDISVGVEWGRERSLKLFVHYVILFFLLLYKLKNPDSNHGQVYIFIDVIS